MSRWCLVVFALCAHWAFAGGRDHLEPGLLLASVSSEQFEETRIDQNTWAAEFGGIEGWVTSPHWTLNWDKKNDSYVLRTFAHGFQLGTKDDGGLYEKTISSKLGELLREVWFRILMTTRYTDKPVIGTDGEHYVFYAWVSGYGTMQGGTSWPNSAEAVYAFVRLGKSVAHFTAQTKGSPTCAQLVNEISMVMSTVAPNQPLHTDAACGRAGERQR